MSKAELIEKISARFCQDEEELKTWSKKELLEYWNDLEDYSDLFPNGRDFDAENEDGI